MIIQEVRLDIGRIKRLGMVEAIWGEHKSIDQIIEILKDLDRAKELALVTRVGLENGEQISHSASVTVDRLDKFLQSGAQYFLQNCSCENNYGCIRFSICMPSGDEMIIDDNGVLTSGNNNNNHHNHHNNIVLKPSATLLQFYQFKRFIVFINNKVF